MKLLKYMILVLSISAVSACSDNILTDDCQEKGIDPACICTAQYDPVCGCNDKTYSNSCVASCSGITSFVAGECPK